MIRKQAIVFLALFHLAANAEIYSSVVADVTDGLIGHWKLDEMSYDGTVGEVVDSSGTQCAQCYYNATGLNDYATMPAAWK